MHYRCPSFTESRQIWKERKQTAPTCFALSQRLQLRRGSVRGAGGLLLRPEPRVYSPQVGVLLRQRVQVPTVESKCEPDEIVADVDTQWICRSVGGTYVKLSRGHLSKSWARRRRRGPPRPNIVDHGKWSSPAFMQPLPLRCRSISIMPLAWPPFREESTFLRLARTPKPSRNLIMCSHVSKLSYTKIIIMTARSNFTMIYVGQLDD